MSLRKQLHRYLDDSFTVIMRDSNGEQSKYYKNRVYRKSVAHGVTWAIIPMDSFFDELYHIFGMEKKELKPYIKSWCMKNDGNFQFDEFWETENRAMSESELIWMQRCSEIKTLMKISDPVLKNILRCGTLYVEPGMR
jgi:hypothetical protein